MAEQQPYSMNMNVLFKPLELIDLQTLVDATSEPWYNPVCRPGTKGTSITPFTG
jgi:hypothetical protein